MRYEQEDLRRMSRITDILPRMEDVVDQRIVQEVSLNARATLADLSAAVGLSVSAVQSRLRRLEARGVITGYRATVDAEAVGKPLSAFIEITPLDPAQPDNAPELLEHLSEIEACHSIAGDASYILFVRVASPRHLESLIRDIRSAASVNTRTTVVLQTFYENRPVLPG
jgi:Lrp/AsnC family leucine-responsive transcriptional regulator